MIITIDGGAASGKSTAAVNLANALGYYYINSGMLYRTIAYLQQVYKLSLEEIQQAFEQESLIYLFEQGRASVIYQHEDITIHLKTVEIEQQTSIISQQSEVRQLVNSWQHTLAKRHNVVIEGRDCGTAVFPDADYKFFFTASLEERAHRWQKEQYKKYGKETTLDEAKKVLSERDQRDMGRPLSPLRKPADAVVIDTTMLHHDEVLQQLMNNIKP